MSKAVRRSGDTGADVETELATLRDAAFFAKVSDPRIGGTYMTLLNTIANLGHKWPSSLAMFLVATLNWYAYVREPEVIQVEQLLEYKNSNTEVIAISMDNKDKAIKAKNKWGIANLNIAYGLLEEKAREWGLYISKSIKESESAIFSPRFCGYHIH